MARNATHKWAFKPGMRAGAFSWRSSAKAIERLKSASAEIRAVARTDPVIAAEGEYTRTQKSYRSICAFEEMFEDCIFRKARYRRLAESTAQIFSVMALASLFLARQCLRQEAA